MPWEPRKRKRGPRSERAIAERIVRGQIRRFYFSGARLEREDRAGGPAAEDIAAVEACEDRRRRRVRRRVR